LIPAGIWAIKNCPASIAVNIRETVFFIFQFL
jgi:hypothetical protein